MNFLTEYPKVRKWLYFVQWVLNGIAAVLGAFFVATGTAVEDLPQWYVIPLAVLPVLWTYLGLQAGANTPGDTPPPEYEGDPRAVNYVPRHRRDEFGETTLALAGLVVTVVGLLLLLLSALDVLAVSIVVAVVVTVVGVVLWVFGGGGGVRRR